MKIKEIFRKIKNETVTVELKTGVKLYGVILEIDKNMNMHLKNVKRTHKEEKVVRLSKMSIRGNCIRYIILPIWLNLETILSQKAIEYAEWRV